MLRYLAERWMDRGAEPVKEYQIATEVFGRPGDFDPRLDATVRVQTGRLRAKLAEYYAGEGAADPVIVEIPKGAYAVSIRTRAAEPLPAPAAPVNAPEPPADWWRSVGLLPAACVALLAALIGVLAARPGAAPSGGPPPALRSFWQGFTSGPEPPLVVFSNAEFVGRPESGMRYFDPSRDGREAILDHYTGVGEVLAIHELDRLFAGFYREVKVKRGGLFSLDDAKGANLILIGSPSENVRLRDIPASREFVFRTATAGDRKGDLGIVNLKPQAGEEPAFYASRAVPITEDYAVVDLLPGMNAGRSLLILAGTTTIGTQAAVEHVCREENLRALISRVGTGSGGGILPFEAVIRVEVAGGVPVSTWIVALHRR